MAMLLSEYGDQLTACIVPVFRLVVKRMDVQQLVAAVFIGFFLVFGTVVGEVCPVVDAAFLIE